MLSRSLVKVTADYFPGRPMKHDGLILCELGQSQKAGITHLCNNNKNDHLLHVYYAPGPVISIALQTWCYYYPPFRDADTKAWKG